MKCMNAKTQRGKERKEDKENCFASPLRPLLLCAFAFSLCCNPAMAHDLPRIERQKVVPLIRMKPLPERLERNRIDLPLIPLKRIAGRDPDKEKRDQINQGQDEGELRNSPRGESEHLLAAEYTRAAMVTKD